MRCRIGSPNVLEIGHVWMAPAMAPAFWLNYVAQFVASHLIHLLASLGGMQEDQRYVNSEP